MKNLPLTQKMIIAFLTVAILPLLGSFAVNAYLTYDELKGNTERSLQGAASAAAQAVDDFIVDNLNTIRVQSLLPTVVDYLSLPETRRRHSREESQIVRVLDSFRRRDHVHIRSCALYDGRGRMIMDTFGMERGNGGDLPGLTLAEIINRGTPVVMDIRRSTPHQAAALDFLSPVRNVNGDVIGVLKTSFNVAVIQKIVFENEGLLGPGSLALLVDERGQRIADSHDPGLTVKDNLSLPPPSPGTRQALFTARLYTQAGNEYLCAAAPIAAKPWTLVFALPWTAFLAVVQKQFFLALFLIVLFASLAAAAAVFASRSLARPLLELTEHTRQIGRGFFGRRLTPSSGDEIGQLTETINEMTAAIEEYHQEILTRSNHLQTLLSTIPDAFLLIGRDGRVLEVNNQFCTLFDYDDPETIFPLNILTLVREGRKREELRAFLSGSFDRGEGTFEFAALKKDGVEVPLYLRMRRINLADEELAVVLLTDLTAIKEAQELVRQSEEKYRRLVENANSIILHWDTEGRIIFMNPYALDFFGYTWEEVRGRHVMDVIVPEIEEHSERNLREMIDAIIADPDAFRHNENENVKKSGERCWISWTNRAIVDQEGRVREVLSIGNDITEKRNLQNKLLQAQKLESIGTLAGGIAHDFNNLLMGIQGYVSLLRLQLGPESPHIEKLRSIEKQVESGARLTRQLLGFARGGKYEVKMTNMNELIAQNAEMFQRTKKELRIIKDFAPDILSVQVDRNQMDQVFLNLYINAWQAMPAGGDIFIKTENVVLSDAEAAPRELDPGGYVKITVRDTGVGMDEKTSARVFDPFFTTKEMGRGTGLGLASVYGIVKNHGGHIEVTSRKGQGAAFHIYLPAVDGAAPSTTEQHEEETVKPGGETIMVIDDEETNTEIIQKLLETQGYRVITARSGTEAVAIYGERWREIDLVIIDMIMPVMDGGETFAHLARINPDIRAVLASGYSLDKKAKGILAQGVKAFIQKPFRMAELSRSIREVLNGTSRQL